MQRLHRTDSLPHCPGCFFECEPSDYPQRENIPLTPGQVLEDLRELFIYQIGKGFGLDVSSLAARRCIRP